MEGGTYQLTSADLAFTDLDDTPVHITYKVTNTASGKVSVDGAEASSFTAAQVAAGLVTFRHDGASAPTTAYFSVSGDDGNQDKSAATNQIFRFTVTPVNDPLQDFKFSTSHGGASALAVTIPKQHEGLVGYLSASDEDGTPITYGVADPRFKIVDGNELRLASTAFQDGEVANVALTATSGSETLNLSLTVTTGNVGEATTTAYDDDSTYVALSTPVEGVVRLGGGRDVGIGTASADAVDGEGNEDNLYGGAGNDTVYGGTSEDIVVGDAGDDSLYGGDGGDMLSELWDVANSGHDLVDGGNGIDILYSADGNDVVYGGTDDANNWAHLGAGDDTYYGSAGTDVVYGLRVPTPSTATPAMTRSWALPATIASTAAPASTRWTAATTTTPSKAAPTTTASSAAPAMTRWSATGGSTSSMAKRATIHCAAPQTPTVFTAAPARTPSRSAAAATAPTTFGISKPARRATSWCSRPATSPMWRPSARPRCSAAQTPRLRFRTAAAPLSSWSASTSPPSTTPTSR